MACGCAKSNVCCKERGVRILVGAVLVTLAYTQQLNGWAWLGLIPLLTGLMGYCPVYSLLKRGGCCDSDGKDNDCSSCCK
jgi:hypothetical protein